MIITDLMELDGKYVVVHLDDERIVQGVLHYVPSYSEMYEWRRPHYFYVADVSFRAHHALSAREVK